MYNGFFFLSCVFLLLQIPAIFKNIVEDESTLCLQSWDQGLQLSMEIMKFLCKKSIIKIQYQGDVDYFELDLIVRAEFDLVNLEWIL